MDKNHRDQLHPPGSSTAAVELAVPQDCASLSQGEGGAVEGTLGNVVREGEEAKELRII